MIFDKNKQKIFNLDLGCFKKNLCSFESTKSKNRDRFLTFKRLLKNFEKYGIALDKSSLYISNIDIIQNIVNIDLRDENAIRDYITYKLNESYLKYCKKWNMKPKGIIFIPEHMINTYTEYTNKLVSDKKLAKIINEYLNKYIDQDGTVYFECYEKWLQSGYKDIKNCKEKDYTFLMKNLIEKNRLQEKNFKFNKVVNNNLKSIDNTTRAKLKVMENIISTLIPYNYRVDKKDSKSILKIIIDDKLCWKVANYQVDKQGNEFHRYWYNDDGITVSTQIPLHKLLHEYLHFIQDSNYLCGNKGIMIAECDFIYGLTKGKKLLSLNEIPAYFKEGVQNRFENEEIYKKTNIEELHPYATKVPLNIEKYYPYHEMLPILCQYLLLNLEFYNNKVVDKIKDEKAYINNQGQVVNQRGEKSKILENSISYQFNSLCNISKELAAFLFSFLKGEFVKK